jgi:hypothetical protein
MEEGKFVTNGIPNVNLDSRERPIIKIFEDARAKRLAGKDVDDRTTAALEERLQRFERAFLSVPQSFNLLVPPARKFLEKTYKPGELSKKGLEVARDIQRYRLGIRVNGNPATLAGAFPYENSLSGWSDATVGDCFLDDPYAYVLEYQNALGAWEVIALAAARPDFENNVLVVDQLQGNGSREDKLTAPAKKARSRFNTATCLPFLAMCILAKRAGFEEIGLRRLENNTWQWKEQLVKGENSPYRTVAARFHLRDAEGKPFLYTKVSELGQKL